MSRIEYIDDDLNIKICRFMFYALALCLMPVGYFLDYSYYPIEMYLPQGVFIFFAEPIRLSFFARDILSLVWYLAGTMAAFGLLSHMSSAIFFLISFFAFNISHNYGYHTHTYMPIVLTMAALAFGGKNKIFLIRFVFCSVFFMAGLSKIRNGGLLWFSSANLQNILIRSGVYYSDAHFFARSFDLNLWLSKNLSLTKGLALLVILIELSAPLAIFKSWKSKIIVFSILTMQVGIYFTIFVNFKIYLLMYLFWIDWRKLLNIRQLTFLQGMRTTKLRS